MIGKVLKRYRLSQEYGVREMAWVLGISAATVSRIERGEKMNAATMLKLIDWLFK